MIFVRLQKRICDPQRAFLRCLKSVCSITLILMFFHTHTHTKKTQKEHMALQSAVSTAVTMNMSSALTVRTKKFDRLQASSSTLVEHRQCKEGTRVYDSPHFRPESNEIYRPCFISSEYQMQMPLSSTSIGTNTPTCSTP